MARKPDNDSRGNQKGAQAHAEGMHGALTHEQLLEQRRSGANGRQVDAGGSAGGRDHRTEVHHIHKEGAEQNDPAERASLRNQQYKHPDTGPSV